MKVLLINPNTGSVEKSVKLRVFFAPILPTGIGTIAAVLENAGIQVRVMDQFATRMSDDKLLAQIKEYDADIIGISCLTPVMKKVRMLIPEIRRFSKAKIVLGGMHPTIFAKELLEEKIADVVVRGEGEITMLELVNALKEGRGFDGIDGVSFLKNGKVVTNPDRKPVEDLDTLPYPAWHLFDLDNYNEVPLAIIYGERALPLLGSRGCPFKCMFCAQDKVYPTPRYRNLDKILDEIEFMYSKYGVKKFGFMDANFPFSVESGIEFCDKLIKRGLHKRIKWITETRVDLVNEEVLRRMKEAGVHLIMFGFETGDQNMLDSVNKRTTVNQAREVMRVVKELKIYTLGLFMLGLPGETRKGCLNTIRLAKELDCDIAKFNLAIPYPGSKFFDEFYRNKGEIVDPEKFTGWYDWADDSKELVYVPPGMTSRELMGLQRKAMFDFYVRPKIIFQYVFGKKTSIGKLFYGGYILVAMYIEYLLNKPVELAKKLLKATAAN